IVDWVRSNEIDEIVVAPDDRRGRLPLPSLIDCRLSGTPIIDHQRFWERETRRVDLAALKPDWFVYSEGFASGGLQRWAKRVFDIAVSASMLLLLSPVLALTALAIFLEDGGPAIYRQERVGFRGRRFTLMKLRSMRVDAEADGPKWADQNDCRVTLVGAFIRKTRIDELPQLINVLKGDMSLVGPRPERPFFVDSLKQLIPYYELRHCVKPGVTGWAQLNYPYGASIEDAWQKLEYDLYYIRSNNVFWDFLILLQTGRVVIWPKGVR
ncbi:MAG: TIGR03013 family PEP-CTERM/XrtA system glycosyltransferase, partial [Rhodospirillales bacterium]|nr:TIGR03013 family PEP-CTERM/XrtA system glycosyltransferase [Rhodospirillales bacterium]